MTFNLRRFIAATLMDRLHEPILIIARRKGILRCVYCNRAAEATLLSAAGLERASHFFCGARLRGRSLTRLFSEPDTIDNLSVFVHSVLDGLLPQPDPPPTIDLPGHDGTLKLNGIALSRKTVALYGYPAPRAVPGRPTTDPVQDSDGFDYAEHYDATTGLMNRHALRTVADAEIARARRHQEPLACLFIMLHNFKEINQHHGHQVGDLLLENTGIRIREGVRQSDFVFRWEGTNFVVLLPHLATKLDVAIVAEKLSDAITLPYRFRGLDITPGCQIGISLFPDDAVDYDQLINCANSAVIEAERRRTAFLLYDHALHAQAVERLTIRSDIQRAFEKGEFEVFYQPILYPDGRIAGAEALMRWNHAERGFLSPDSFIAIAEESHLITLIDKVAIYSACKSLAEWSKKADIFLSLNISARHLSDSTLPEILRQAMAEAGLDRPGQIKLELTENRLIENATVSSTAIATLHSMGVDTWIDDFGTGQSSLTYLKHLPVTTIKLDREFVREIATNPKDMEYLQSIVDTVRARGKDIVVEGIASAEQYRIVHTLPVTYLQGFYFAGPMRAEEFEALLNATAILPIQ